MNLQQQRERRVLIVSGAYAVLLQLYLILEVVVGAQYERLLLHVQVDPRLARIAAVGGIAGRARDGSPAATSGPTSRRATPQVPSARSPHASVVKRSGWSVAK